MDLFNKNKKAQGLPLNTIVLAILVIIVLLVIIVFFTSKMGDTSKSLDQNAQIAKCSTKNVAIAALGFTDAQYSDDAKSCSNLGDNYKPISVIPSNKDANNAVIGICCGTK